MDEQWLARHVVENLLNAPEMPTKGRYLPIEEADRIVSDTINYVGQFGDPVEYKYLVGHRRRLAASLSMVPIAESPGASCLDVGCFGYMAFWAWKHLGYGHIEGIELRPDIDAQKSLRSVQVWDDTHAFTVHNFDISSVTWPIERTYDTLLFLETLEHVNMDPLGVLLNVASRMTDDSRLLISVPNALSYKVVQEILTGAPPWTYWFFHPDLQHEPRHCFEYTPIFFKMALSCAGFTEQAFRTLITYVDRADLDDIFEIGDALSIHPRLFGDTLIAQVIKSPDAKPIRYPACIYDGERYYQTTFPVLEPLRRRAVRSFVEWRRSEANKHLTVETQARVVEIADAEARAAGAMFVCEQYLMRNSELQQALLTAQMERAAAASKADQVTAELEESKVRLQEALYLCEQYINKGDVPHEQSALEHLRATLNALTHSTSWRITAPMRRFGTLFPGLRGWFRSLGAPIWRGARSMVRTLVRGG